LSPRISTTMTRMCPSITIDSSRCLVRTNM
jgi:hypothetical protein